MQLNRKYLNILDDVDIIVDINISVLIIVLRGKVRNILHIQFFLSLGKRMKIMMEKILKSVKEYKSIKV